MFCFITTSLFLGEDIPIFPVEHSYLQAVKERVNLARELDELQLRVKKVNSEVGWFQKAAEDMDIIIDDLYPLITISTIFFQILGWYLLRKKPSTTHIFLWPFSLANPFCHFLVAIPRYSSPICFVPWSSSFLIVSLIVIPSINLFLSIFLWVAKFICRGFTESFGNVLQDF